MTKRKWIDAAAAPAASSACSATSSAEAMTMKTELVLASTRAKMVAPVRVGARAAPISRQPSERDGRAARARSATPTPRRRAGCRGCCRRARPAVSVAQRGCCLGRDRSVGAVRSSGGLCRWLRSCSCRRCRGTRSGRARRSIRYLVARGQLQARSGSRRPSFDRLDQRRVDVGFAADRRRVAERLGDRLDHRLEADRPPRRRAQISSKAIALAPQVRKCLAVNSSPIASRI